MRLPRLTYANVVATLALFVALGGGAYAVTNVGKNSVTPAALHPKTLAKLSNAVGSPAPEGTDPCAVYGYNPADQCYDQPTLDPTNPTIRTLGTRKLFIFCQPGFLVPTPQFYPQITIQTNAPHYSVVAYDTPADTGAAVVLVTNWSKGTYSFTPWGACVPAP